MSIENSITVRERECWGGRCEEEAGGGRFFIWKFAPSKVLTVSLIAFTYRKPSSEVTQPPNLVKRHANIKQPLQGF